MEDLAYYLVLAFAAAHFVAMFNWSRLGPILAIDGAFVLREMGLSAPFLLVSVLLLSSILDLFIGSASAKWSALAPVVVPMFMLLGISPEMTTAAYRMGDSYTNIMTPLMSYFPLILAFARRWDKDFGVGSLLALMLPYALTFMVFGIALTAGAPGPDRQAQGAQKQQRGGDDVQGLERGQVFHVSVVLKRAFCGRFFAGLPAPAKVSQAFRPAQYLWERASPRKGHQP